MVPELKLRGMELPERSKEWFSLFLEELMEWNEKLNLHGYGTEEEVVQNLFLDSLAPAFLGLRLAGPLADLGTGAGVPGLPLKFAQPDLAVTLMDARKKKLSFLDQAIATLKIEKAVTLWGRAEELAHRKEYRASFGTVTAKAIGSLSEIVELALPLLRPGGVLLAYKGARWQQEIDNAKRALALLKGRVVKVLPYSLAGMREERGIIVLEKSAGTPAQYPRRAGLPHSEPL